MVTPLQPALASVLAPWPPLVTLQESAHDPGGCDLGMPASGPSWAGGQEQGLGRRQTVLKPQLGQVLSVGAGRLPFSWSLPLLI